MYDHFTSPSTTTLADTVLSTIETLHTTEPARKAVLPTVESQLTTTSPE